MSGSINGLGGAVLPPLPDSAPTNSVGANAPAGPDGSAQASGMTGMQMVGATNGLSGTQMSGMAGAGTGKQMAGASSAPAGSQGMANTGAQNTGAPATSSSGAASGTSNSSSSSGASSNSNPLGASGEDTFLKLLVAQMHNQDPSSPMDTTSFVTELAQFNTVEQMLNLSQTMQSELSAQQATEGTVLLGRTVTYATPNLDGSGSTPGQGLVQGVSLGTGGVQLQVNGQTIPLGQVTGVSS